jgi:hypothetical protein
MLQLILANAYLRHFYFGGLSTEWWSSVAELIDIGIVLYIDYLHPSGTMQGKLFAVSTETFCMI